MVIQGRRKFRESGCKAAIVACHKRGRNDDLARSTIRDGWVTSVVMGCERLLVRGNLFDPFFLRFFLFFFFFIFSLPLLLFHLSRLLSFQRYPSSSRARARTGDSSLRGRRNKGINLARIRFALEASGRSSAPSVSRLPSRGAVARNPQTLFFFSFFSPTDRSFSFFPSRWRAPDSS